MTSDTPVPWVQHRRLPPLDPEALRRSTEGVRQRRIEREAADRLDRAAVALAEANETVEAASLMIDELTAERDEAIEARESFRRCVWGCLTFGGVIGLSLGVMVGEPPAMSWVRLAALTVTSTLWWKARRAGR